MFRTHRLVALSSLLTLLAATPLWATPARRPLKIEDLAALRDVAEPALAPDGAVAAYSVTAIDRTADASASDLVIVTVASGEALRLTRDAKTSDWLPRFSPDGKWLAFLSDRGGKTQVWRLDRRGGEPEKLTDFAGGVSDYRWSPDSSRLVVVARDPKPDSSAPAGRPKPIVIDRLFFKSDAEGFHSQRRDHLHLFDLASKSAVQLTNGPWDDSEPVYSPDGRRIAFVSNRTPDADLNYDTDVWVIEAYPGAEPRRVSAARFGDFSPTWSPDGRWLAWVQAGEPAETYYSMSRLAVAAVDGGTPRELTAQLDRNVYAPRFSADGTRLYFYYEDHGNQPLGAVSLSGGVVEEIVGGERYVHAFELGAKDELVVLAASPHQPAELFAAEGGELRRLSRENDAFLAGIELAPVERFAYTNADGIVIEGFFYRPPQAEAGARLPALLRIHGGPVDQHSTDFNIERQIYAAHGYLVIAPNPRGSSGRGRDFAYAIWADWGNKDYDDVMGAVDHAIALGYADPDRLGVLGWSYGGILTNYVITKTSRFKAAMSGASEVNYLGNYGHDQYLREWEAELGLPWQETAKWVELSPWFEVERVTTPTLLVCGQDDWNVPLHGSEQLYQALRRLGKQTELVIYPGENHSIDRPSFQIDRFERYLGWFDRFVLGTAEAKPEAPKIEATSLLGVPLVAPSLSDATRTRLESDLAAAQAELAKQPTSADAAIWVARRLGYLGRHREAIAALTAALALHPDDVRILRHRGHRWLSVRELRNAIADLERAASIVVAKGLPDELEPDGAPNELGVPTSTTQFNLWYHLGLAHYLSGDFERAAEAYRTCLEKGRSTASEAIARGANDRTVATTDWLWLTLMRLDRREEAAAALAAVASDLEVIEDQTYLDRIRLYKGETTPEALVADAQGAVDVATRSYAVGSWYLVHGDAERARAWFERTLVNAQWGSFAVLAAEAEIARAK